jgi:hypothetical protein
VLATALQRCVTALQRSTGKTQRYSVQRAPTALQRSTGKPQRYSATALQRYSVTALQHSTLSEGFRDNSNVVRIANVFAERKAGWGDQGAGMLMLPSP